jgi:hypothetical protein
VVVDSVDLWVVSKPPSGVTVVPFVSLLDLSVTTPLLSVLCSLLLELEPPYTGAGVAELVVVVVEEDDCARAPPVIIARAAATASQVLVMSDSPKRGVRQRQSLGVSPNDIEAVTDCRQLRKLLSRMTARFGHDRKTPRVARIVRPDGHGTFCWVFVTVVVLAGIAAGPIWRVVVCCVEVVRTRGSEPQALSSKAAPSSTVSADSPRNEAVAAKTVVWVIRAILFVGVAGCRAHPASPP